MATAACTPRPGPGRPQPLRSPHRCPGAHHTRLLALPHLRALEHAAAFATALSPPQCFTAECQGGKDAIFLASLAAPVALLAGALAWLLRPPPEGATNIFRDDSTGLLFESRDGGQPEVDSKGELALRAVGYTPWPVEAGAAGERVRLRVGPVGATQPRTFLVEKVLAQPSQVVVVTLPRPMGVVFEEDRRSKRVVVGEIVPGSNADQLRKRTALDPGRAAEAVQEGDVLRATTATNIVYPTKALLFGAKPPERVLVLFGADGQRWPVVAAALRRGLVADGEVTLVLERRLQRTA